MTECSANSSARLDELLLDEATGELYNAHSAELDNLRSEDGTMKNPFMETAALVQLGLASMDKGSPRSTMPESLRRRLLRDAPCD